MIDGYIDDQHHLEKHLTGNDAELDASPYTSLAFTVSFGVHRRNQHHPKIDLAVTAMQAKSPVKSIEVRRYGGNERGDEDLLAVEEPLEIKLEFGPEQDRQQRNVAVTMRTPGHDLALAAGFLLGEGLLRSVDDIFKIDYCANVRAPEEFGNVVKVDLQPGILPDLSRMERNFYTSSSCGVCGKASIEAIGMAGCPVIVDSGRQFSAELIRQLRIWRWQPNGV